jgi:hypothetical protein
MGGAGLLGNKKNGRSILHEMGGVWAFARVLEPAAHTPLATRG